MKHGPQGVGGPKDAFVPMPRVFPRRPAAPFWPKPKSYAEFIFGNIAIVPVLKAFA